VYALKGESTHLGLLLRNDLFEGENLHLFPLDRVFQVGCQETLLSMRIRTRERLLTRRTPRQSSLSAREVELDVRA
jgi:hypothetical protein